MNCYALHPPGGENADDASANMKKLLYALNILSAIPGVILIPLAPFSFLITDGEGGIPGFAHEYAFMILLPAYSLLLVVCVIFSLRAMKCGRSRRAFFIAAVPWLFLLLIVWVFVGGGIRLR